MARLDNLQHSCDHQFGIHVIHVTDEYSPAHPGVTAVIRQLSNFLIKNNWATSVLTPGTAGTSLSPVVTLREFPLLPTGKLWRYPRGMAGYLRLQAQEPDSLFHIHGAWSAPQWLAVRAAGAGNRPVVLSLYDMLSPWQWRKGRLHYLKKLLYWRLIAQPAFRQLSLVHAVTPLEKQALRKLFPTTRLELIPNAIDLEEADILFANAEKEINPMGGDPYILFLGRLDPQKGVDLLIEAFARSRNAREFRLAIVGSEGDLPYVVSLKDLVKKNELENRVQFLGPIFGPQKWCLYRDAWAGCLPSRSDSISIASLEFGATAIPTITTHDSGLYDWQDNGGVLVHPQLDEITQAIDQACAWSEAERRTRGQQLRNLVAARYSWGVVGRQWLKLYWELLQEPLRP